MSCFEDSTIYIAYKGATYIRGLTACFFCINLISKSTYNPTDLDFCFDSDILWRGLSFRICSELQSQSWGLLLHPFQSSHAVLGWKGKPQELTHWPLGDVSILSVISELMLWITFMSSSCDIYHRTRLMISQYWFVCWLIIKGVQWYSSDTNFLSAHELN